MNCPVLEYLQYVIIAFQCDKRIIKLKKAVDPVIPLVYKIARVLKG